MIGRSLYDISLKIRLLNQVYVNLTDFHTEMLTYYNFMIAEKKFKSFLCRYYPSFDFYRVFLA